MILKIRKNYFIFGLVFLVAFFIFLGQVGLVRAQTGGRNINTFEKPFEGTLFATEWNDLLGYNGFEVFANGLPLGSFVPTFLPAMMLGPLGIGMEPVVGGARLNVKADGTNNILSLQNNVGTEIMTVLNSGNVGIGTTNPVNKLQIGSVGSYSNNLIAAGDGTAVFVIRANGSDINQYSGGSMRFFTGFTERMILHSTGNVGIGTTNPTQKLSIGGSATSYSIDAGNQRIGNVADPDETKDVVTLGFLNSSLSAFAPGGASSTWALNGNNIYNTNSGNVGIGTSEPLASLDVKGIGTTSATFAFNVQDSLGANKFRIQNNGQALVSNIAVTNLPEFGFLNDINTGLNWITTDTIGLMANGTTRFSCSGAACTAAVPTTLTRLTTTLDASIGTTLTAGRIGASSLILGGDPANSSLAALEAYGGVSAYAPPSGASIFYDTFSGGVTEQFPVHTPDTGTSWTMIIQNGVSTASSRNTGFAGPTATVANSGVLYTADANYTSADYEASTYVHAADNSDDLMYLAVRIQDANNMYAARISSAATGIYKKVGGTWTLLSPATLYLTAGNYVKLRVVGNVLSLYRGDALLLTVSDSDITAAGKAGLGFGNIGIATADDHDVTWQVDNFSVKLYEDSNLSALFMNGNVGIGTTTPTQKLSIGGSATYAIDAGNQRIGNVADPDTVKDVVTLGFLNSSLSAFAPGGASSTWALNGNNIYNTNSGNVGIGTTAPTSGYKLDVNGNFTSVGWAFRNNTAINITEGWGLQFSGDATHPVQSPSASLLVGYDATGTNYGLGNLLVSGNVGIGMSNPQHPLDVVGYIRSSQGYKFAGSTNGQFTISAGNTYFDYEGGFNFRVLPSYSSSLMLLNNGNVGIGTTTPTQKLSIGGSATYAIDAGNQRIGNVADPDTVKDVVTLGFLNSSLSAFAPGGASSTWALNGNNIYNTNSGNVGIGTINPNNKLNIYESTNNTGHSAGLTIEQGGTGDALFQLLLTGVKRYQIGLDNSDSDKLKFGVGDDWVIRTDLTIDGTGNVGIGTTAPGAALHVNKTEGFYTLGSVTFGGPLYKDRGAASILTVDNSGNVYATSTSAITTAVGLPTSATNGQTLRYNNGSWIANSALYNNGTNVGIGTTNPSLAKLQIEAGNGVVGQYINGGTTVGTDLLKLRANAATQRLILEGAGGVVQTFLEAGGSIGLFGTVTNHDFRIRTNYVDRMTFDTAGNVGIGTTTPTKKLHVNGETKFDGLSYGVTPGSTQPLALTTVEYVNAKVTNLLPGGASSTWALNGNNIYNTNSGNVGIGTSTPGLDKLRVVGGPVGIFGSLNLNNNNITGINKLTVNTIDPLYNIGGTNYSTFAAAIVGGVKEEYVGRLEVKTKRAFGDYEAVIDFNKQKEGTDLWVWHKTVDFSKENVEVFLSPYGDFARTYFLIEGEKLIVRADRPVTVSYRLVGRRLDWREWPTKALDQEEKAGFVIN